MNYIIIDTETTGLPNKKTNEWPKIISIAIIHASIINDEMDIYSEDEYFITDWVNELSEDTSKFLKLNKNIILKNGVSFDTVKTKIINLIKDCKDNIVFIAHNVLFDYNVIKTCGLDLSNYNWFCTMNNAKMYFNNKYPKLLELAKFFNIDIDNTKLHQALYDTQICANIFYCMKTNNYNTSIKNIRLLKLRNRIVEITYDV